MSSFGLNLASRGQRGRVAWRCRAYFLNMSAGSSGGRCWEEEERQGGDGESSPLQRRGRSRALAKVSEAA